MTRGEDRLRVIGREVAVRIVEEELDREYQSSSALGVNPVRVVVACVEEHELVWLVHCQVCGAYGSANPGEPCAPHQAPGSREMCPGSGQPAA